MSGNKVYRTLFDRQSIIALSKQESYQLFVLVFFELKHATWVCSARLPIGRYMSLCTIGMQLQWAKAPSKDMGLKLRTKLTTCHNYHEAYLRNEEGMDN